MYDDSRHNLPRFLSTYSILVLLKTLLDVFGIMISLGRGFNASMMSASGDPFGMMCPPHFKCTLVSLPSSVRLSTYV